MKNRKIPRFLIPKGWGFAHPEKATVKNFLIPFLKEIVRWIVVFLAILMTLVIFWAAIDTSVVLYDQFMTDPYFRLESEHLFAVFKSFLTALIAIEIFLNIIVYLEENMFHVKLVIATALTAVVRKVIVLDYSNTSPDLIYALAAIILAVGVTFWISGQSQKGKEH